MSVAGLAWACTPQQYITTIRPQAAEPGQQVSIEGNAVAPETPVEIHWDGLSGANLASTTTDAHGAFSVSVKVPDAAPGVYSFVAVFNGTVARAAFQVDDKAAASSAPARAISTELWSGFSAKAATTGEAPALSNAPAGPTSGLKPVGAALTGLGALALMTALTLIATRKRDAKA